MFSIARGLNIGSPPGAKGDSLQPEGLGLLQPERLAPALCCGVASLDALLPLGGLPRGRLSEFSGRRCCGKRALALRFAVQALQGAENVVWVDGGRSAAASRSSGSVGGRFYPLSALEGGAPLAQLLVVCPADGAALFKAIDVVLGASGAAQLLVVDLPLGAVQSRQISKLARLARGAERSGTAVLFVTERLRAESSLGTFISLQLWVERKGAAGVVSIIKSKSGRMAHKAEVSFGGPHSVHLDSTL